MATILIVDDSPTEMHVIRSLLESNGFTTVSAMDGEEALRVARAEQPDLILMDVVMPGMNGFQATRELARDPATSKIPVIMVTTKDQDTDRAWGMRQGAKDYVVKPFSKADLLGKIGRFIE
ncbi:MAG: response regulator [Chromatiales bacterium]|nr:response regulator [Chromatiales bacterium]